MTDVEELEKKFEEVEEHLDKTVEELGGFAEVDISNLEAVTAQVQMLGDQLDMRLRTIPEEAKEVRISKLDVATLARILNGWARDLEQEVRELNDTCKQMEKESERLGELSGELGKLGERIIKDLDNGDPKEPELDLGSMLRNVETTS